MTDCENLDYEIDMDEESDSGEEKHEFTIVDDRMAEWALKKVKGAQAEYERLMELADIEIEEIKKKKESLELQHKNLTGFLKGKLYDYFQKVDHKATKTQESYKLLSGSLVWKKPTQKMVPDKDKLLEYVKKYNMTEFVKVKEEVDWATYKKECEIADGKVVNVETGDILPEDIIVVEDVPGSFDVK